MRRLDKRAGVVHRPVIGADLAIFADVIAIVAARAGVEGQQPDRGDAEFGDIIQLRHQPGEIADAIIIGIEEGLDVHLIDDGVLVPEGILVERGHTGSPGAMRQMR